MAKESFTNLVLTKAQELAADNKGEVTADALSVALGLMKKQDHKRMLNTLSDLHLQGRIQRIRQGVYVMVPSKPDKREVMWRVLRMRRRVTVEDLVEMAEVSARYAIEWLQMLAKREVVRKHQQPGLPGTWQLISDTIHMPEDNTKAHRLREMRMKRKEAVTVVIDDALKNLQTIGEALSVARDAIHTMEDKE